MNTDLSLTDQNEVKRLISSYAGLTFSANRASSLDHALKDYLRTTEKLTMETLLQQLKSSKTLLGAVTEHLLVHETYFFRENECLQDLKRRIDRSNSAKRGSNEVFRVWSAGCSTGEEPYTLSILLSESSVKERFQIIASDISEAALRKARQAKYTSWSLRALSEAQKRTYFTAFGSAFELTGSAVKERVTFTQANLYADNQLPAGWTPLDVILCRNVLIYFERPAIAKVAQLFFSSLKPGGYLLTSASDPILSEFAGFETESTSHGVIYRRPLEPGSATTSASAARVPVVTAQPYAPPKSEQETIQTDALVSYNKGDWQAVVAKLKDCPEKGLPILIKSMLNLSQRAQAATLAAEASRDDPLNAETHLLACLAQMELKDYQASIQRAKKAIFLNRNFIYAHFILGIAQFCSSDKEGAVKSLNNARTLLLALDKGAPIPFAEEQDREELSSSINRYLNLIHGKDR